MTIPRLLTLLLLFFALSVPGAAQVSIIGELSQDREAPPGGSYDGEILVRNDSREPQEAKIYQTDYAFSFDGTNRYDTPGSLPRSNARWVRFSPDYVVIPALSTATVNYTVSVPADSTGKLLGGTYWSMLMVEGISKESPESALGREKKRAEMGVRQTLRYGIQIATTISGTGKKSIRFIASKLLKEPGGAVALQVDLEDDGTLGFRPEVYAEIFDSKGGSRGKFPGHMFRMYPGTSVRQTIALGKLPPGSYKALVVVDAGGEDVFGAQYTLQF